MRINEKAIRSGMQPHSSESSEEISSGEVSPPDVPQMREPPPPDSSTKSIWGFAKETLNGASAHVSKAAAIGSAGAAKTAEISKQGFQLASDATRSALESSKQAYAGSTLESAINLIDDELDKRGAKKAISDTTGAVIDKLDQLTGKRLVELLEMKLRVQDEYNDILATRLAEALDRIGKLEARLQNGN
jgi:hypothetical protein